MIKKHFYIYSVGARIIDDTKERPESKNTKVPTNILFEKITYH